jgi:ammonium transporter, Amt family
MRAIVREKPRPSWSEKLARLAVRSRDPEWRRYGALVFAGKMAGVALVALSALVVAHLRSGTVYADDVPIKPGDIVNAVNTAWTLVAAFLVFGMQVGFTMLEAGFCRYRETVNVLVECVFDTCLCGVLFYAFGYAFMFSHGNGFIGYH